MQVIMAGNLNESIATTLVQSMRYVDQTTIDVIRSFFPDNGIVIEATNEELAKIEKFCEECKEKQKTMASENKEAVNHPSHHQDPSGVDRKTSGK